MKILALSVLLVAMMALALATEAPPQAEDPLAKKTPVQEKKKEEEADDSSNEESESQDEEGEEAESPEEEKEHDVAKRSLCRCRCGWRLYRKTYFRYYASKRTWAQAQHHCRSLGGNLASVHNAYEDNLIRSVARNREVWIGFSDAQQNRYWFWSDGSRYNYRRWCRGQPDNAGRREHCAANRFGRLNCWNDVPCLARRPYVCARRRR